MDKELRTHEWLTIILFSFLLILVGTISYIKNPPAPIQIDHNVQVNVVGAVNTPTTLTVPAGTSIKEVLSKVELKPGADISKIKTTKKLYIDQKIHIPSSDISINIQGAVSNPGLITVPKGTRFNQLNRHIKYSESADSDKMNKKRVIKDGETIKIPYKAAKRKSKKSVKKSESI